jgi:hypothetical protein
MTDPPPDGSEVFGDYVTKELERQIARKASFEQRGLAVITTAGALVTLLFGLAALSTNHETFMLPSTSKVLLLVALGFFIVAIGAALATNVPLVYQNVTPQGLSTAIESRWTESPSAARRTVARTQLKAISSARTVNGVKAWLLFAAITCELCAVSLVGGAMGFVIYSKTTHTSNAFVVVRTAVCVRACTVLRVEVILPGSGSVTANPIDTAIGPLHAHAARSIVTVTPQAVAVRRFGTVKLVIKPAAKIARAFAKRHCLRAEVRVSYKPTGGVLARKTLTITVTRAAHGTAHRTARVMFRRAVSVAQ